MVARVSILNPRTRYISQTNTLVLPSRIDIKLDICPDDVLGTLPHTSALMQQRTVVLAMWEHRHRAHNRPHWVGIHDTVTYARRKEGRLAALKLIIQVHEEGKQTRLLLVRRRGIVHVLARCRVDARGRPGAIEVAAILGSGNVAVDPEATVDAPRLSSSIVGGDEGTDTLPESVMEGLVNDPVDVVGEDAGFGTVFLDGCVGEVADRFGGSDNGLALGGREDIL